MRKVKPELGLPRQTKLISASCLMKPQSTWWLKAVILRLLLTPYPFVLSGCFEKTFRVVTEGKYAVYTRGWRNKVSGGGIQKANCLFLEQKVCEFLRKMKVRSTESVKNRIAYPHCISRVPPEIPVLRSDEIIWLTYFWSTVMVSVQAQAKARILNCDLKST